MNRIKNTYIICDIEKAIENASSYVVDGSLQLYATVNGMTLLFGGYNNIWLYNSLKGISSQIDHFGDNKTGIVYILDRYSVYGRDRGILNMITFPIEIN